MQDSVPPHADPRIPLEGTAAAVDFAKSYSTDCSLSLKKFIIHLI